jgi:hypothetical protein
MALLRLELEIDSDVYPELYARLASLHSLHARHEKLRQLAAVGLVWELVRLHGPALLELDGALAAGAQPAHEPPPLLVPPNLPVLMDAVDEDIPLPPQDVPSVTMATVAALRGDIEQPQVVDGGTEEEAPQPLPASRSGRSSRLKRMKARGLFHTG